MTMGFRNRPISGDSAARGCLWIIAAPLIFILIFGAYGFYADWVKP